MKAEWRDSNGQEYLLVEAGNHFELGVATGQGLVKQLEFSRLGLQGLADGLDLDLSRLLAACREFLPFIPDKYLQEMKGMAQGASEASVRPFGLDDILVSAVLLEVVYGRLNLDMAALLGESLEGCTNFGAINPDGSVVMGQNYDAQESMLGMTAWVLHKVGEEPWVFSYRLAGCPALPMAKNEHGLTMTVSVVDTDLPVPLMTPRFVRVREAMATCTTAEAAYEVMFEDGQFPFSLNLLIGDNVKIIAVQVLPDRMRPTYVKSTIVQSNDFDYLDWVPPMRRPGYSTERQAYSEQKLREMYEGQGGLSNQDLLEILRDSPIICRDQEQGRGRTIAFMTRESFGLGTPAGPVGKIPLQADPRLRERRPIGPHQVTREKKETFRRTQ